MDIDCEELMTQPNHKKRQARRPEPGSDRAYVVTCGLARHLVEAAREDEARDVMLKTLARQHVLSFTEDEITVRRATFEDFAAFAKPRARQLRPGDEPGLFDVSTIPTDPDHTGSQRRKH
jgi:hypothetical protein